MIKYCEKCNKVFNKLKNTSLKRWDNQRFCSIKCSETTFLKGIVPIGGIETRFKEGHKSYERDDNYRVNMSNKKIGM